MAKLPPSVKGCVDGERNTPLSRTHHESTLGDRIAPSKHLSVCADFRFPDSAKVPYRDEHSDVAASMRKLTESHIRLEIRSQNQAAQLQRQILASLDNLASLVPKDSKQTRWLV